MAKKKIIIWDRIVGGNKVIVVEFVAKVVKFS